MATKTIDLEVEAYEKLKAVRRHPGESLSEVILRGRWPEKGITAGEWLRLRREHGPFFAEEDLQGIEDLKRRDQPPSDKWQNP